MRYWKTERGGEENIAMQQYQQDKGQQQAAN
jgi:hypothetical protein